MKSFKRDFIRSCALLLGTLMLCTLAHAQTDLEGTAALCSMAPGAAITLSPNNPRIKILKDKGVQTVIVVGTASNGAVLNTASHAALSGMNVIVPVDGISAIDAYAEQYVAWHFVNAPGVSAKTTLTKIDMIKF